MNHGKQVHIRLERSYEGWKQLQGGENRPFQGESQFRKIL